MGDRAHGHLSVRAYGDSHGSHDHDHFQILIGLTGALELEVNGRGQRIGPGQGCVVPPGERHDFESRQGARCLVLDSRAADWAGVQHHAPSPTVWALARYLADACHQGLPQAQQAGPQLLLESWSGSPGLAGGVVRYRRPIDWTALADWARQHWSDERLEVADLARQVHLSPAQLAARCRAELGRSTQQWLRQLQLDHARALRAQGLAVAQVARLSGYRSPSALTAALRRQDA